MKYFYTKGWFRAKKAALAVYTQDEAKVLHDNNQLYCVLVGDIEKPTSFLEINHDFFGVSFLDEILRPKMDYQFTVQSNGKLFLSMAVYREYENSTDNVRKGTTYIFSTNGNLVIQEQSFPSGEVSESHKIVDIKTNWEEVPEFGDYTSLLRQER